MALRHARGREVGGTGKTSRARAFAIIDYASPVRMETRGRFVVAPELARVDPIELGEARRRSLKVA